MAEVFTTLEALIGRGRYVPHASTEEFAAQPRLYEQEPGTEEPGEQQKSAEQPGEQPEVLAINAEDFSALEERIARAAELVMSERKGRAAAEERVLRAEETLNEHARRIEELEQESHALKSKSDDANLRVKRLLVLLDALESSSSAEPGRRPVTSISDRAASLEAACDKSLVAAG